MESSTLIESMESQGVEVKLSETGSEGCRPMALLGVPG